MSEDQHFSNESDQRRPEVTPERPGSWEEGPGTTPERADGLREAPERAENGREVQTTSARPAAAPQNANNEIRVQRPEVRSQHIQRPVQQPRPDSDAQQTLQFAVGQPQAPYAQQFSAQQQPRFGQSYDSSQAPYNYYGQQDNYYGPQVKEEKKAKNKKQPGWSALIVCSALAALIGGGIGVTGTYALPDSRPRYVTSEPSEGGTTPVVSSKADAPDWAAVADAVGDSVVSIQVSSDSSAGEGSGVIFDSKGNILTNDHVVANARQVYVTLADGRVFEATVIGTDPATDLAVIQIENAPDNLTVATLGDSSTVGVGDPVAAIGNPMGLASTLTTGVVSALDRPTAPSSGEGAVTNAIQIDAAINPGNSGGPVFNDSGQVVGIASSIITTSSAISSGGSIGLGFAIPINLAKNISSQLVENGVAEHAYLGVTIRDGVADYEGQRRTGAEVVDVQSQTPAALAGLKSGDVVTQINGKAVGSSISLTGYVRQFKTGEVVTLQLVRGGQLMEIDVTLATKPDNFG